MKGFVRQRGDYSFCLLKQPQILSFESSAVQCKKTAKLISGKLNNYVMIL